MARGIGGDDGPSLFMFGACVLGFIWLRDSFTSAKESVSSTLELGKNSGGILQPETTEDISTLQKSVDAITVRWTKCPHGKAYYLNIAAKCWTELSANYNTDEAKLFAMLSPLSADELRAVAKTFGVRETSVFGLLTLGSYTIFKAFDEALSDGMFGNDLTKMRKIWAKTGLW